MIRGAEGGSPNLYLYADEGDDSNDKWRIWANTAGQLKFFHGTSGEDTIVLAGEAQVELMYDNSKKFETYSDGVKLPDGTKLSFNGKSYIWDNNTNNNTYWMNDSDSTDIDVATAGQEVRLTAKGTAEAMVIATADAEVDIYYDGVKKIGTTAGGVDIVGNLLPSANDTYNLGSSSYSWNNLYVNDLHFSNSPDNPNSVDGTWGDWTLQEGEEDIFMLNNRSGKKYKMNLTEVS